MVSFIKASALPVISAQNLLRKKIPVPDSYQVDAGDEFTIYCETNVAGPLVFTFADQKKTENRKPYYMAGNDGDVGRAVPYLKDCAAAPLTVKVDFMAGLNTCATKVFTLKPKCEPCSCPENSLPKDNVACPTTIDECDCIEGFEKDGDECVPPPPPQDCKVDYACAKCGQILECYIDANEGSAEYTSTKSFIKSSDFCYGKTKCGGQQCDQMQGLVVYPADAMNQKCPVLDSFQCYGGAGKGAGAGLSNWATYQFDTCVNKDVALQCSDKCDSGKCGCKYGSDVFCSSCK